MKKTLYLIPFIFIFACEKNHHIANAEVPAPVITSFNNKYSDATSVEWEKEKEHGDLIYEAKFDLNGKHIEAEFRSDGTLIYED